MSDLKFTSEHEWLRQEADGSVTIGITEYAQEQLGDIVYVELPPVGNRVGPADNAVVIESVKAVGEVRLPVAGTVVAVNERLADEPELVNGAPQDAGWLVRVELEDAGVLAGLMDAAAYRTYVAGL
jgi:glycine cleavage system H protein